MANVNRKDKVTVNNLTKMFGKLLVLNEISFTVGDIQTMATSWWGGKAGLDLPACLELCF
ncbi:MAG: hypothetical protein ACOY4I_03790 [Bacillota bacterium]